MPTKQIVLSLLFNSMILLEFPPEIILCIADKLDQAKDLLNLACLNRATNALLLEYLYKFNVRHQRSSALFWGVLRGKSEFVEMMLRNYEADANTTDDRSRTPIFYAIRTENATMIRTLLFEKRADINWQDHRRQTPLVYAIARKLLSTASLLLDFDPCLKTIDVRHRSAIWYAIAVCDESLTQVLLERGSDIRTPDYKQLSPFSLSIAKDTPKTTRLLLLHSDPNLRTTLLENVTTRDLLLWQAVKASLQDIVALLVAHGADPSTRTWHGGTLLHQAMENGDSGIVQQLLAYEEIPINATNIKSYTALHIAAAYGRTSVVNCLLAKYGIDLKARDIYGRTAFQIAAEHGHSSITGLLLASGAVNINAQDAEGSTALCSAAGSEHTAVALQILAEDHVDVNVANQTGTTALHHAAKTRNIQIACALLANGDLDPNVLDKYGWAPLTSAAWNGDLRMVELFLAREDIQVNVQESPPLFYAASKGHEEIVRRLLCFGTIDINQQLWNSSPLCIASGMGYLGITKLLLDHTISPDINLKTDVGDTALSLAASGGYLAIINLLLEKKGLDVTAVNKFGDTALCKAARNGHEQVVKRLYGDARAKCASDVKRAIEAASNRRIALYLEGHLNEQGNSALNCR
ncbi:hypothetical protein N7475_000185 [Penicillium sp. IBT 31633x]|nr:hypothetical protein N7475_000185 [Penicillium sp. IBT 31633x]